MGMTVVFFVLINLASSGARSYSADAKWFNRVYQGSSLLQLPLPGFAANSTARTRFTIFHFNPDLDFVSKILQQNDLSRRENRHNVQSWADHLLDWGTLKLLDICQKPHAHAVLDA